MQEQREDPQKENAVSGNDADDADELACKPKATSASLPLTAFSF